MEENNHKISLALYIRFNFRYEEEAERVSQFYQTSITEACLGQRKIFFTCLLSVLFFLILSLPLQKPT